MSATTPVEPTTLAQAAVPTPIAAPLTILVPYDGSPLAAHAVPYAAALAQAVEGRLILVQAVQDVVARRRAESELAELLEQLWTRGLTVESHVRYGDPGPVILDGARAWGADLIAMATHGRSGLGRWRYGSVAEHVLRHAATPLLVVPAASDRIWTAAPEGSGLPPRRVLVPLDGSAFAEEAIGPAARLAAALGGGLLLAQAVVPPTTPDLYGRENFMTGFDAEAELARTRRYLTDVAEQWNTPSLPVEPAARLGTPAATIATLARERGADAIAMATHGRGGLARLVLGSVAAGVLHRATVPLLLVRPAAVREAAAPDSPATEATEPPSMVLLV
jgi:nucleotide-binding universal stress UspA family protein